MNTIEGNKLIIDFLGWKHHSGDVYWFPNLYPSQEHYTGETTFNIDEARFHSSWDWLIPVVEKINNLKKEAKGVGSYQWNLGNHADEVWAALASIAGINPVWQAIIQFIEWYNSEQSVKESDTTNDK